MRSSDPKRGLQLVMVRSRCSGTAPGWVGTGRITSVRSGRTISWFRKT